MTTTSGTTTSGSTAVTTLEPYIYFYGRCEEALRFYEQALGGSSEIMYVRDTPFAAQMPPQALGRVMHASFRAPGVAFMASDGRDVKTIDPDAGNICLSLAVTDGARGEQLLAALSDGGKITMPLDKAFWGGRFAGFVDRFGIEWMIALP